MLFANVIVDKSLEKLDKPFQYIVPEILQEEVKPGCQVEIPFGAGNRVITGYVIDLSDQPQFPVERLKEIQGVKKNSLLIESQLISLAWFIKERYASTMNQALKTVIPVKYSVKEKEKKHLRLKISREEAKAMYEIAIRRKNGNGRSTLLKMLLDEECLEYEEALKQQDVSDSVIRSLVSRQVVEVVKSRVYRNPVYDYGREETKPQLNEEQTKAVRGILQEMKEHRHVGGLLFGVTGSGKTEVYMEVIEEVLKQNREVILLIPEISLTYQTIKRFYRRFGNIVSVINSKLSPGEKYDQFERAKSGEVRIMIGPRSALFTPFTNLGLIIIDEEHDGAYKSDVVPKYHARDVARFRAGQAEAYLLLGSATPSVETYAKALAGEYGLFRLSERANAMQLPQVEIVDMREELIKGNREIISDSLREKIADRLKKKEQIMLFINRRGYSSFVSCRSCGNVIKCPHCEVSLTMHKTREGEQLVCHYCGYQQSMPKVCPKCGSRYIGRFGIGTEQIEERLSVLFPEAAILRMDTDTTRKKGKYEDILSAFAGGKADILLGTQMIVKGHDFARVTLVGILAADLSLFASDFMAGERTFQLLTQAAGRAGRGKISGEVVIQTYNPQEICIQTAAKQDYIRFFENEISYRRLMSYPPAGNLLVILISDQREKMADAAAADLSERIKKSHVDGLVLVGPAKASISKINDVYRNVIYLKHTDSSQLVRVKNAILKYLEINPNYRDISVQFDYNPMTSY